jgi:urease accessory protein
MLVAETYVGHRDDRAVAALLADADSHRVVLSDTERRRSRVRTTTESGTEVGVVVGRVLADGDVLETDGGDLVVVELASVEALVVDFEAADDVDATTAVALGHAAGNRHWDLAVRGSEALFPATESRDRMDATVADELPDGATVRYEAVPPSTFDDGDAADHSHADGTGHAHGHESGDHAHSNPHSHDHSTGEDGGDCE